MPMIDQLMDYLKKNDLEAEEEAEALAERQKGLGLGAAAYVTKPFDVETVRKIVREQAGPGPRQR